MKNSDTKKYVENAIKRAMKKRNQYNQINQNQTSETSSAFAADQTADDLYYKVFITAMTPSFTVINYSLQSFWILNNEFETHICNKIMLHRFQKLCNASSETMLVDETWSRIEVIEKIEISINALERKIWKMLFIEICYILNFLTNIAASRKFRAKEVYFDDQSMRFHANSKTLKLVCDLNDHDVLKHQFMKKSISEKMKMKNEKSTFEKMKMKVIKMKKFVQINNSKQTNNKVFDKIKDEKNKVYQRAKNTQQHSRIKFRSFDFISSNWLKHKNVKSTRFIHIAVDELVFNQTFPPHRNKRTHQFDWSRNQLWRCRRDLCKMIKWSKYEFFQRCCTTNKKHFDHKVQLRWKDVKIYVFDYFLWLNHVHRKLVLLGLAARKFLLIAHLLEVLLLGSK